MSTFKSFIFMGLVLFAAHKVKATVLPAENGEVNSTTVYLEEDVVPGAQSYELILCTDTSRGRENSFFMHSSGKVPAFRASNLAWATSYFWRIEAYGKDHQLIHPAIPHSFRTMHVVVGFHDAAETRFNIKNNKKEKHGGGLLMIDYTRCIYDRNGHALWTLPTIEGIVNDETQIRDMKLTQDNTITFITDRHALEIDLAGNVLWKAPWPFVLGKDTIQYHHDLKKTSRGTYLVLGTRKVKRLLVGKYTDKQLKEESEVSFVENKPYKKTQVSVLLEFDHSGKLVWSWDANTYITDADLNFKKYTSGMPAFSSHANAFSESEDGKTLYVSFRDLSRIVKIDKLSKKVTMSYGEKYPSGDGKVANNLFRKQHDCGITKRNTLLIFNNNEAPEKEGGNQVSSLIEIKANPGPKDSALVFSFKLDYDKPQPAFSPGGGNITELPNGNLLLCAGSLNRICEITREKEVVWDALILYRPKTENDWRGFPQYRCSWLPYIKDYEFIPEITDNSSKDVLKYKITNTGNTADLYHVEVLMAGKVIYRGKTTPVEANETLEQTVALKTLPKTSKNLVIRLYSQQGRLTKELSYEL